jgi:hypothetical protein
VGHRVVNGVIVVIDMDAQLPCYGVTGVFAAVTGSLNQRISTMHRAIARGLNTDETIDGMRPRLTQARTVGRRL